MGDPWAICEILDVSNCAFKGQINRDPITAMTSLWEFHFGDNLLTGLFPTSYWPPSLSILRGPNNQLTVFYGCYPGVSGWLQQPPAASKSTRIHWTMDGRTALMRLLLSNNQRWNPSTVHFTFDGTLLAAHYKPHGYDSLVSLFCKRNQEKQHKKEKKDTNPLSLELSLVHHNTGYAVSAP
jgi:hypothetical protein